MQHLHHYPRWQRLKYRWERLPKTHRFALMESGAGVLHIYGKNKGVAPLRELLYSEDTPQCPQQCYMLHVTCLFCCLLSATIKK